ncbi:MAG: gramicidin biosynthesis protein, partial [Alphaproteobacteria bacterium]|nr:gramicidin biosynthesis protein [Alphaproteobacteria bacterium]
MGTNINHITLEGHGREDLDPCIDITRTMGWFTTFYPVRLECVKDLSMTIKTIKENLRSIPNKGIGYGALFGYRNLPRILFNYLGQFEGGENGFWSITPEGSGLSVAALNKDSNLISMNGRVVNGQLEFWISASIEPLMVEELATRYKENLQKIIQHTNQQGRSYLTVSDVGYVISQEYLDQLQKDRVIEGVYLANSLQQGFIYHALSQGEVDDSYRVQLVWDYQTAINVNKLRKAWEYALKKYSALRLRFGWAEELVQIIDQEAELDWRFIDLSEERDHLAKSVRKIQEEDRREGYNLAVGSLIRVYLIKQREDLYSSILSNHHAILDGWSRPILMDFVHKTYLNLMNNQVIDTTAEESYIYTQQYIQEHEKESEEYWKNILEKVEERIDLNYLIDDPSIRINEYKHIKEVKSERLEITGKLYDRLKELSRREGITFNAILQFAWHKVLSVYGGSKQTIVGVTVSGRNLPIDHIEQSVGL